MTNDALAPEATYTDTFMVPAGATQCRLHLQWQNAMGDCCRTVRDAQIVAGE